MDPLYKEQLYVLIIKPVLLVAVLSTNIIVVVAWLSPRNKTSVSVILSLIAIYDTATIFFGTMYTFSSYIAGNLLSVSGCYINLVAGSFAFIFHSTSILTTTYLACQRCVICLFPFSGPRICGQKTTVVFSVVSFVFVTSMKIPFFLVRRIEGVTKITNDNSSVLYCKTHYLVHNDIIDEISDIIWFIRLFTLHLIPALFVTFSMIACMVTVNRRKMVSGRSSDQRSKTRTTVMLVLVSLIFVLGEFPTTFKISLATFFPTVHNWLRTSDGIQFSNLILVVSFLMNVLVYVGMSKQFRVSLKELICRSSIEPVSSTSQQAI